MPEISWVTLCTALLRTSCIDFSNSFCDVSVCIPIFLIDRLALTLPVNPFNSFILFLTALFTYLWLMFCFPPFSPTNMPTKGSFGFPILKSLAAPLGAPAFFACPFWTFAKRRGLFPTFLAALSLKPSAVRILIVSSLFFPAISPA